MALGSDPRIYLDDAAPKLVAEYFETFTGRAFNTVGGNGDAPAVRDTITAADLVSLSLLSAEVRGPSVLPLLDEHAEQISAYLADVPTDVPLWAPEARQHVETDTPVGKLWKLIESVPEMGWVRSNKLLARKRPRLIPVYDEVVKSALEPDRGALWTSLWEEFQKTNLVKRLREVRSDAGLADRPDNPALLRILDVAIWMRDQGIPKSRYRNKIHPLQAG